VADVRSTARAEAALGAKELRLITFRIGPETFVLDIMAVRQIIPYAGSTSVPTAPPFVEGIIVLRNEVVPVVDLRQRLYPHATERAAEPLVLITHSGAGVIGLKVDEVRRIVTVNADALIPPPPLIKGIRGELLIAVLPHGDEVYLVIDVEAVLSADEKVELRAANLTAPAPAR
jgi:purine-binding chemotaxis protein CheW